MGRVDMSFSTHETICFVALLKSIFLAFVFFLVQVQTYGKVLYKLSFLFVIHLYFLTVWVLVLNIWVVLHKAEPRNQKANFD